MAGKGSRHPLYGLFLVLMLLMLALGIFLLATGISQGQSLVPASPHLLGVRHG